MLVEKLLEKKDQDSYRLLCEVYRQGKKEFLIESLRCWMDVSTYSFWSLVERMNEQWQELFGKDIFGNNKKTLTLTMDIDLCNIQIYEHYLRRRSISYEMLDRVLKLSFDIDQFATEYYISLSQAYQIRKDVQEFLAEYGIDLRKNSLYGEEKKIRGVMMGFYLYWGEQQKMGLSRSSLEHIDAMKKMVIQLFNLKPSLKQENLLTVFLTTCEIRESQECYVNNEFGRVSINVGLETMIRKVLILDEEHFADGLAYLMVFLYVFKFIDHLNIEGAGYEKVLTLTKQYKNWFKIDNLNNQIQFRDALLRLHGRCLFFEGIAMNYAHHDDSRKGIGETEYQQLVNFVQKNPLLRNVRRSIREDAFLIREYSMLMSAFQRPFRGAVSIEIVLDFSQGECFNEMLRETLQNYREYDWHFRDRISNRTDIYISDSIAEKLSVRQLVWEGLPTINELKRFMEIVREIGREKESGDQTDELDSKSII